MSLPGAEERLGRKDLVFETIRFDVETMDRLTSYNWLLRTAFDVAEMSREIVDAILQRNRMIMIPEKLYFDLVERAKGASQETNDGASLGEISEPEGGTNEA
jgi:hypothetical protein